MSGKKRGFTLFGKKKGKNAGASPAATNIPEPEDSVGGSDEYEPLRERLDEFSVTSSLTSHPGSQGALSDNKSQLDQGRDATDKEVDDGMNAEDRFMQYYQFKPDKPAVVPGDDGSAKENQSLKSGESANNLTDEERKARARAAVEARKRKAREAVAARKAKQQQVLEGGNPSNAKEKARMAAEKEAQAKAKEEARIAAEEEAEAKVKAEEEARSVAAKQEAAILKAEEEARIAAEEEAEAKVKAEEEAARLKAEEARTATEEAARFKAEDEARVAVDEKEPVISASEGPIDGGLDDLLDDDLDDLDALLGGDLDDQPVENAPPTPTKLEKTKKKKPSPPKNSKKDATLTRLQSLPPSKVAPKTKTKKPAAAPRKKKTVPGILSPPSVQRKASISAKVTSKPVTSKKKSQKVDKSSSERTEADTLTGIPATVRGLPTSPRRPAKTPDRTGSVGSSYGSPSITRLPRSPWRPKPLSGIEEPTVCDHPYQPTHFHHPGACQICVFRLSDAARGSFVRNGRHLRVNFTKAGCLDCQIFPSNEDEEPVRICRQCFFDTHELAKPKEEAFTGVTMAGTVSSGGSPRLGSPRKASSSSSTPQSTKPRRPLSPRRRKIPNFRFD